jgi:hypothetical protein
MKVVINSNYGGFGLSKEGCQRYWDIKGQQVWIEDHEKYAAVGLFTVWLLPPEERMDTSGGDLFYTLSKEERAAYNKKYDEQTWYERNVDRKDPILVQVVEELGQAAAGQHATLKVVEIPDDIKWIIDEYDGRETIEEVHRTWS